MTARTIWRWMAGTAEPSIGALVVLVSVLGVTADWLLCLESDPADDRSRTHEHTFDPSIDANTRGQESA